MANLEIMTNPMRGMLYPVRGHVRAFKSGDISPHFKCGVSRTRRVVFAAILFAIAPISNFSAAKDRSVTPRLAGYKAVRDETQRTNLGKPRNVSSIAGRITRLPRQ